MGGTSTDVALYAGAFERAFETQVAGVRMRAPMMAINTVAAGGGSMLHFDGVALPRRAGQRRRRSGPGLLPQRRTADGDRRQRHARQGAAAALPGDLRAGGRPAARRRRRDASISPPWPARSAAATGRPQTPRHVAEGFLRVAVSNMANAIKQVSIQKGQDATRFALQCFGGAGGQHACLVADELGMETVFIHPFAGVLSAYGMGLADQSTIREGAVEAPLSADGMADLEARLDALAEAGRAELLEQGADPARLSAARRLHLRYAGTDTFLPVPFGAHAEVLDAFTAAHRQRFGFATPEREVVVEACVAEVTAAGERVEEAALPPREGDDPPEPIDTVALWTAGAEHQAPVFDREALRRDDRIPGPALIREANATTVVEPGWTAEVTALNHLLLRRTEKRAAARVADAARPDPVMLELFNNLFMSAAEQAGAVLRNTSLSRQHQGAAGLLLRRVRRGGRAGRQRAARAGASRRHGRERADRHPLARRGAQAGRRGGAEQPLQRRHPPAGRHRHHARSSTTRARRSCSSSAAAATTPTSAASRPAPPRPTAAPWRRRAW